MTPDKPEEINTFVADMKRRLCDAMDELGNAAKMDSQTAALSLPRVERRVIAMENYARWCMDGAKSGELVPWEKLTGQP